MVRFVCLLLVAAGCGALASEMTEEGSAKATRSEGMGQPRTQAEIQQIMDMMKNYKNHRLFLANHGKRSIPMEDATELLEDLNDEEVISDDDLSKLFSAPNGFFFSLRPSGRAFGKRSNAITTLSRPNGFMFPSMKGKRGEIFVRPNGFLFPKGMGKRATLLVGRGNPNGFNFPMAGKRKFELDLEDEAGNFFGQRGKRYTFSAARGKKDEYTLSTGMENGHYFMTTRG